MNSRKVYIEKHGIIKSAAPNIVTLSAYGDYVKEVIYFNKDLIDMYLSMRQYNENLLLGGSLALMLMGIIPPKKANDLDVVLNFSEIDINKDILDMFTVGSLVPLKQRNKKDIKTSIDIGFFPEKNNKIRTKKLRFWDALRYDEMSPYLGFKQIEILKPGADRAYMLIRGVISKIFENVRTENIIPFLHDIPLYITRYYSLIYDTAVLGVKLSKVAGLGVDADSDRTLQINFKEYNGTFSSLRGQISIGPVSIAGKDKILPARKYIDEITAIPSISMDSAGPFYEKIDFSELKNKLSLRFPAKSIDGKDICIFVDTRDINYLTVRCGDNDINCILPRYINEAKIQYIDKQRFKDNRNVEIMGHRFWGKRNPHSTYDMDYISEKHYNDVSMFYRSLSGLVMANRAVNNIQLLKDLKDGITDNTDLHDAIRIYNMISRGDQWVGRFFNDLGMSSVIKPKFVFKAPMGNNENYGWTMSATNDHSLEIDDPFDEEEHDFEDTNIASILERTGIGIIPEGMRENVTYNPFTTTDATYTTLGTTHATTTTGFVS